LGRVSTIAASGPVRRRALRICERCAALPAFKEIVQPLAPPGAD